MASVLRNLMIALSLDVTGVEKGSKKTQDALTGIEKAVAKTQQIGSKVADAGQSLTTKVSLPLAGIAGTALKMGGDFEQGMNKVKAISGATGDEFEKLRSLAKELGASTQYSASEAADAMGFLAMAGFRTDEIMGALPGTLSLAAAGAIGLGEAADIASNILSGYGMEVSELSHANDVLAKTFTSTNVDMLMLGESFKYVGPVASSAGLAFEETSAAIGMLGNAGIQGSQAGTTLRMAISRMLSPTKAVKDVIGELGLELTDSKGKLLPLVDIIAQLEKKGASTSQMMRLFGVEAGPGMQALVSQGSGALRKLTGELEKSGGTADHIAKVQMEGFNGSVVELQSAFEGLMIEVAESGLLQWATDFVKKLAGWTQALTKTNPQLLRLIVIIGGVVAAVGPLLFIGGKIIGMFGSMIGMVHKTITVVRLLSAALFASPIGWIIGAIALIVAALVLAYNKFDWFRNGVQAAWRGIQTAAAWAWNNVLKPAFTAIWGFITKTLAPIFVWLWKNVITPAWKGISAAIQVAWAIIKIAFAAAKLYVEKVLAPIFLWLWKNVITPAWKGISFAVQVAWGILKVIFAAVKLYVEKVLAPIFLWLWRNVITPAWNGIKAAISVVWERGVKPAFEAMKKGVGLVGKAFDKAKDFIGRTWDKVRDLAMKPVRFVVDTVYTRGIKGVWDKVAKFVGADPLPAAPAFQTGGIMPGYTPGRDNQLIWVGGGEAIMRPEWTRAVGPDYVHTMNAAARRGGVRAVARMLGLAGDPGGLDIPGYAEGGIVGWVKSFGEKAKGWFVGGLEKAANAVFGPIRNLIDRTLGTSGIGGLIGGVPKRYMDAVTNWLMEHREKLEGGPGRKAVAAARKQIGVPYSWGGGGLYGPTTGIGRGANTVGFDCSALLRYGWYQATGKVSPRTTYTQMPWVKRIPKPVPGAFGFPSSEHVFMASDKPGRIIEAPYTGAHVRETAMRPAWWGVPPWKFDDGGVLPPGTTPVYNGTRKPEYVFTQRQLEQMRGGDTIIFERGAIEVPLNASKAEVGREVVEALREYKRRGGRLPKGDD